MPARSTCRNRSRRPLAHRCTICGGATEVVGSLTCGLQRGPVVRIVKGARVRLNAGRRHHPAARPDHQLDASDPTLWIKDIYRRTRKFNRRQRRCRLDVPRPRRAGAGTNSWPSRFSNCRTRLAIRWTFFDAGACVDTQTKDRGPTSEQAGQPERDPSRSDSAKSGEGVGERHEAQRPSLSDRLRQHWVLTAAAACIVIAALVAGLLYWLDIRHYEST